VGDGVGPVRAPTLDTCGAPIASQLPPEWELLVESDAPLDGAGHPARRRADRQSRSGHRQVPVFGE